MAELRPKCPSVLPSTDERASSENQSQVVILETEFITFIKLSHNCSFGQIYFLNILVGKCWSKFHTNNYVKLS